MKGHLYQITVEHLEDAKGNAVTSSPLVFKARNHDDLFPIVEKMKTKQGIDASDAEALAIGLKLFGEVMLKNRNDELFSQLQPHFREFIKALKQR
jgi:hypothetical protein